MTLEDCIHERTFFYQWNHIEEKEIVVCQCLECSEFVQLDDTYQYEGRLKLTYEDGTDVLRAVYSLKINKEKK